MGYRLLTRALVLVIGACIPACLVAQPNNLFFKHLTPADGLTQVFVNETYTDSKGFVWMTGLEGVNRFDGIRCLSNNAIAPGIENPAVTRTITEDRAGNIWFGTNAGLLQFSYIDNRFYLHKINSTKSFKNKLNIIIAIDNDNNILFGRNNGELLLYNIAESKVIALPKFETNNSTDLGVFLFPGKNKAEQNIILVRHSAEGICLCTIKNYHLPGARWEVESIPSEKEVNQMSYMPDEQTLFFCGSGKLYKHNLATGKRTSLMFNEITLNILFRYSQDKKGRLWVSGLNSLYAVDTAYMKVIATVKYNRGNSNGVSSNSFHGMADRSNNLWISALGKGVDYAVLNEQKFASFLPAKDAEVFGISNFVRGIAEDKNGNFYCATQSGVIILDKNLSFTKHLPGFSKLAQAPDLRMAGNRLLIAADEADWGLYEYDLATGTHKKHTAIFYKQKIHNGRPYQINIHSPDEYIVASVNTDFFKFNLSTGSRTFIPGIFTGASFGKEPVYSFTSGSGNFYAGYNLSGFTVYRFKNDNYESIYNSKAGFTLKHIIPAGDNRLWLATTDGLLLFDDKKTAIVKQYKVEDGLPNNVVYALAQDERNNLWVSTNKGLSYFDVAANRFINFTKEDGLQENEFNSHAVLTASDGRIIFGGINGLTVVNPGMISYTPPQPMLQMTMLKADSALNPFTFDDEKALILPAGSDAFQSEWTAINFTNPLSCKIRYRLSGINKEWQLSGNPATISYTRLLPGKYVLEVMASNTKGEFGNGVKKILVVVKAYWWQTTLFKIIAITFLVLLCFLLIRNYFNRRLKHEKQKLMQQIMLRQERDRITADLHDDIGATLSSMNIYGELADRIWETKPDESKRMLEKISHSSKDLLARMGDIIWSMKPANEEKHALKARLLNHVTELLTPVNIISELDIDEKLTASITNPEIRKNILLIAKEAINNIAKYSNATKAILSFQQQQEKVLLTISDNGKGLDTGSVKYGNGLQNMEQRCKFLQGQFSVSATEGGGVTIHCVFPIASISRS